MNKVLKIIADNLTSREKEELIDYLQNIDRPKMKCPKCGSLGYLRERESITTTAFYPHHIINGRNVNLDGNISTIKFTCGICGQTFCAKFKYDKCLGIEMINEGDI